MKQDKTNIPQLPDNPGMNSVSQAAKGEQPQSQPEESAEWHKNWAEKTMGKENAQDEKTTTYECGDLERAYQMIFGGMSLMMKAMSEKGGLSKVVKDDTIQAANQVGENGGGESNA